LRRLEKENLLGEETRLVNTGLTTTSKGVDVAILEMITGSVVIVEVVEEEVVVVVVVGVVVVESVVVVVVDSKVVGDIDIKDEFDVSG